jgi:4-amino-4-deoxy-L-arabinose transferase-like glycosyltransferase
LIVIPQALFGAGTVLCAFLIGNELFGERTGITAALLTALYPYYVVHDTALQETGMVTFAAALSVYMLLRARSSPSVVGWLGAGALLGLSVLVPTTMLPFTLFAVAWIALFGDGLNGQRLLRATVVFLALLITVGTWMARNYFVVGGPVLTSEAGYQFWMAHNPATFSRYPDESIDRSRDVAFEALTPSEKDEIAYVWEDPGMALKGIVRKVATGFS